MKRFSIWLLFFSFLSSCYITQGQDTTQLKKNNSLIDSKAGQAVKDAIWREPPPDALLNVKSEIPFLPYEGKIIRNIIINQFGFDRTLPDTSRWVKTTAAKIANRIHNDTKDWVIRDNLFIQEGKPLNPYRVADNERYLRDLEFILDSRIYVLPISDKSDSVDLLVTTRDVFSLGVAVVPRSGNEYDFRVQEANLAGMGQKLQMTGVYDYERTPQTGFGFLYQKTNVLGSFVNASVGYTEINTARSVGNENEYAYFFRLDRPLYNPFARWAGALEWSRNWSKNVNNEEQNTFEDYQYVIRDVWAGYSFGLRKLSPTTVHGENRNRTMISMRAYDQNFITMPDIPITSNDSMTYVDRSTALGQITFFKQNFYKTRYVLGFGRTEDLPYGYQISLTGGWEKERGLKRAYTGAEVRVNTVTHNGTFYTYALKLGNYLNEDLIEDALAQISVSRFSRLYIIGKNKVRHYAEIGYAAQLNQTIKRGLDINDMNGITGFKPDSLYGTKRLRFKSETVVYTTWKLIGFHLAPLVNFDLAWLGQEFETLTQKDNFYTGFGTGIRMRNENLIFNTVEARIYYYPRTVEDIDSWRAEFRINLRLKYPTTLVTAPSTVYNP